MGTDKVTFKCNYIGMAEEGLASQQDELSPAGISISPNSQDNNYCWYESGGEFVGQVGAEAPFFKLSGLFYPESLFVYFNKGAPDEIALPPQFIAHLETDPDIEIAEFFVAGERPSHPLGIEDDVASAEETILRHIKTAWPDSVIIDSDIRITAQANGHQNYTVYIAGYNLPKAGKEAPNKAKLPEFTANRCPEWVLHKEDVAGDIQLDGWALEGSPLTPTLSPEGRGGHEVTYLAIPRKELKDELGNRLNRTELAEDLRSRLGFSEYLKSDNPIRLIREITFAGDDGVQGLYCPVFDVEILEIKKSAQTCLEWVERKGEKDIRAEKFGKNGYMVPLGNDRYKYISATKNRNVEGAKSLVYNQATDQDGFDKTISSMRILNDPVCSADEIKLDYSKLPTPISPPDHRRDDARRLEQLFLRDPTVLRKIRGLEQLGTIKWARPAEDGPARAENLINVIKSELHEEVPVERMEVCLVVDQSGSMANDSQYVSDRFDELEAELAASTDDASLCLIRFVDDEKEVLVRLAEGRELHDYALDMREGLSAIAKDPHGGFEYIYEAADLALDQFERDGTTGGKRKIILLTDEKGDLKDGGQTLESINRRAGGLGVDFKTVFIASAGSERGQLKDYLEYLNANGIEVQKMNEGARIGLWEKMLNDEKLSMEGNLEVIKRLSGVSRRNRDRAVKAIASQLGRTRNTAAYPYKDTFAVYEALGRLGGELAEGTLYSEAKRLEKLTSLKNGMGLDAEEIQLSFSATEHILKIATALAEIGTASALARAKELVMDNINDWDSGGDKAILKLAKAFNADEIEELGKKLREFEGNYYTYSQIIKVLGENGSKKAQDILIEFLGSDWNKRDNQEGGKIWTVLAILKNRYHSQAMSKLISTPRSFLPFSGFEEEIVKIIIRDENKLSDAELEKMTTWGYSNPDEKLGYLAELMLAKRGNKDAIAHIEYVVRGDAFAEKWRLADAAELYKDKSAIPWLERLLLDRHESVRVGAIEALKNIDDDRARELVSLATMGNDLSVDSAKALAKADPREAMNRLITLCHDLYPPSRIGAANALAELGDESAIPALSELLGDPDIYVVEAAGHAIEEINRRIELERVLQQKTQ